MSLPLWKKVLIASVVVTSVCGALTAPSLFAQKPEAKPAAADAEKKPAKRLPAYYGPIVDGTQREKIYTIQAKYDAQIDLLAEQIKDLQKKRDAEYEGVLTAEQKVKLEKARADAKAKAAERAAAKKAAEAATAKPPATDKPAVAPAVAPTTKSAK